MIKNKLSIFLFVFGMICLIGLSVQIFDIVTKNKQFKKIKANPLFINGGAITHIRSIHKSTVRNIYFEYSVGGKQYHGMRRYGLGFNNDLSDVDFSVLYNRRLPIAYEDGHPSNAIILFHPKDFEEFSTSFPDSLSWVKGVIKN